MRDSKSVVALEGAANHKDRLELSTAVCSLPPDSLSPT